MGLALPRVGTVPSIVAQLDPVEVAARWAHVPTIELLSTPLARESLPAIEGFLTHVHGMQRRQWEAFAAGGQLSRYSATTDAENLTRLATGERTTGLFHAPGAIQAEQTARFAESLGLVATRYRSFIHGESSHTVAVARHAAIGEAIMRTQAAFDGVERDIAFGMLLGYEPRDIAFFANRNVGYDGVRYLLGT